MFNQNNGMLNEIIFNCNNQIKSYVNPLYRRVDKLEGREECYRTKIKNLIVHLAFHMLYNPTISI